MYQIPDRKQLQNQFRKFFILSFQILSVVFKKKIASDLKIQIFYKNMFYFFPLKRIFTFLDSSCNSSYPQRGRIKFSSIPNKLHHNASCSRHPEEFIHRFILPAVFLKNTFSNGIYLPQKNKLEKLSVMERQVTKNS